MPTKIAEIMLACPDTGSVHDVDLEGLLENFKEYIMQLRSEITGTGRFSIPMVTFRGTASVGAPTESEPTVRDVVIQPPVIEEDDKRDG